MQGSVSNRLTQGASRALVILCCAALLTCSAEQPPDNLLFISIDTLRRDHLPTYGYPRDTAPAIDALAKQSVVFENAYAQATMTGPSHATMLTGVYPHTHGSRWNGEPIRADQRTLAEILQRAGFRTGGFVSGWTMHRKACGLDRGFEVYDDRMSEIRRDGLTTVRAAADWLESIDRDERFFLFLHLFDVHGPYLPKGRYAGMFASTSTGPELDVIPDYQRVVDESGVVRRHLNSYVDRYDDSIRYADDLVRMILSVMDLENTVVVIVADHGETLGERVWKLDHGSQVFDEQTHIPLILHAPEMTAGRPEAMVETVDLLPTLVELLGLELPEDRPSDGTSLVPLLRGARTKGRERAFSSARAAPERHVARGYSLDETRRIHAVRSSRWKLIRYPGLEHDYLELYDLRADPGEIENVMDRFPTVAEDYVAKLGTWIGQAGSEGRVREISPAVLERLRSLGYASP